MHLHATANDRRRLAQRMMELGRVQPDLPPSQLRDLLRDALDHPHRFLARQAFRRRRYRLKLVCLLRHPRAIAELAPRFLHGSRNRRFILTSQCIREFLE